MNSPSTPAARRNSLIDDVDVFAVAGVEDDFLRVALDVADAEVIAERPSSLTIQR